MKKYLVFSLLILLSACTPMVDEPQNLLTERQLSEIIADFAIYDQAYAVTPNVDMEQASRYVLKKHNTTAQAYRESYTYYLSDPSALKNILEEAKEIILDKDPKLEDYIEKKKKENPSLPNFAK